MNPEAANAWMRILRDAAIVLVAVFMLVHETVTGGQPNAYVIGAGLALLGVPPALRLDSKRREKSDE